MELVLSSEATLRCPSNPCDLWNRCVSSEHRHVYRDCSLAHSHGDTGLELIFMVGEGPVYGQVDKPQVALL